MSIVIKQANSAKTLKIEKRTSVTVKGIANYCLVSECTVRRWIKDGKIATLRLPSGQYRVTAADFKDFLTAVRDVNQGTMMNSQSSLSSQFGNMLVNRFYGFRRDIF